MYVALLGIYFMNTVFYFIMRGFTGNLFINTCDLTGNQKYLLYSMYVSTHVFYAHRVPDD